MQRQNRIVYLLAILLLWVSGSVSLINAQSTIPVINEFVFNLTGTDTAEYVEIAGDVSTNYSSYTILAIEGDGSGAGTLDRVYSVGTTSADGYWTTGLLTNELENGTITLLLVDGFSGSSGTDLDTDDDGILDVTPWTAIVDDVAVTDGDSGDLAYSTVVLAGGFDSSSYTPGGASRIPDATDTDSVGDWVRNDYDGEGLAGFTGTPDLGEAINTPEAENQLVSITLSDPVINEFVFNHTGTDTAEYIEIAGDIDSDYSGFTILVIEGDSSGGVIDRAYDVGTTNAEGYWTTGLLNSQLENGTQTVLLVSGFSGSLGDDVDTDDDGIFDTTPWVAVVDDVAVNDGGSSDLTYSSVVLGVAYDGMAYAPGGASRIPDATDTDSVSDWVRNDFDGLGLDGFTGTSDAGEAVNTPDAVNQAVTVAVVNDPVLNEFVFNHMGSDTAEYIEIYADPNGDYSAFTVLIVEGDSSSPVGQIDAVFTVGTTNSDGFWVTGLLSNAMENGTQTALLVEGFTGSSGDDLDTDDDGILDVTPWTAIVDDFAVNDGGSGDLTYSSVVLGVAYDGMAYTPGGASRIPDGVDTDSVSDWVRNDFDGDGLDGFTGSPDEGEAQNTPGAANALVVVVPPEIVRIRDIQGAALTSPLYGNSVQGVPGIVTGLKSNGFFMQDPEPDADIATSEGIYVYTGSTPSVSVGDAIEVSGSVTEYYDLTELSANSINVISNGNLLPDPIILGTGGRVIPSNSVIDNDNATSFDPAEDPLDFYESLEGMLVQVNGGEVVAPTNAYNEFVLVNDDAVDGTPGVRTGRGGIVITPSDFNPERIMIDGDLTGATIPNLNTGAVINSAVVGPLDYTFSDYKIQSTTTITYVTSPIAPEFTALNPGTDQLTIAGYNVENLDPSDTDQFPAIAAQIVSNLNAPDILSLQEVQDNTGATNDGVVSASETYEDLIQAIIDAGGPVYDYREVEPADLQDGGQPGGNIRVGFLFRTDRVTFVDRGSAGATDATLPVASLTGVEITLSPGRIDPTNSAFDNSRKPLVGEFEFNNQKVFVINVHMNSKGGDDGLYSTTQPPVLSSETQRNQQATVINNFVDSMLAIDSNAMIAVVGDTNDFWFSTPIAILAGDDLTNLIQSELPESERYSYVYSGNSQTLDNFLVSDGLFNNRVGFDIVHVNAEFTVASRPSDHDPAIALFNIPFAPPTVDGHPATIYVRDGIVVGGPLDGRRYRGILRGTNFADVIVGTDGKDIIIGGNNDDLIDAMGDNDLIIGDNGSDTIYAGEGDDIVNAGNGNDIVYGEDGNDRIIGGNSNDQLFGGQGRDSIFAGEGEDTVDGGDDDDLLRGDGGQDTIYGGSGNDNINGGRGDDQIFGGEGDDIINAHNGNDYAYGEAGNDTIYGSQGDDMLDGGDDADVLVGGNNNDRLYGQNGDDALFGNRGDDTLDGGADNDQCDGGFNNDNATACEVVVNVP